MKVVINKCFGGFTLSTEAQKRLIELGVPCFEDWNKISENFKGPIIVKEDYNGASEFSDNFDENVLRSHPLLLQVLEELGEERCSGWAGNLRVVEIPDNINWEISNYDGYESIHEEHRSW